jgi:hypothetical protein
VQVWGNLIPGGTMSMLDFADNISSAGARTGLPMCLASP